MKRRLLPFAVVLVPLLFTLTDLRSAERQPPPVANATNRFTVTGMHCAGCAAGLQAELTHARGVASATVTFTNKLAVVAYDTNRTTTPLLLKVVEEAGFQGRLVPR